MTTFVLVHGAWSGAHGFRHVRRLLQREGHDVFTPSLTGIGERVHLASPLVNLGTHIRDVVNHVLYEDLQDIVLVGFSYGGFVVTGALEHIAERVQHLVYLDAFVPDSGESVFGHILASGRAPVELGQEWLVPSTPREFDDSTEGEWVNARRVAHPIGCFTEAVYLTQALEDYAFSRSYIKATQDPDTDIGAQAFLKAAQRAQQSPDWHYHEIDTTHMVPSNRPAELCAILGSLTGPQSR